MHSTNSTNIAVQDRPPRALHAHGGSQSFPVRHLKSDQKEIRYYPTIRAQTILLYTNSKLEKY